VLQRWLWIEPAVWSERNLLASYRKVAANGGAPGVDHVTVEEFGDDLDAQLAKLTTALRGGCYQPPAIRRVYIPKPECNEQRPRSACR
jgi:RNA-directed DNA polymerase